MGIKELLVPDLPQAESLCCVLEQDTLYAALYAAVQPRNTCPNMTEKLWTGT